MFIQEFYSNIHVIDISIFRFTMVFWGTRIVVTSKLIFEVLCVPRVAHFYEKAKVRGDTLNFSTNEFAKGPRILNMVMAFVLTSRSHYNIITEPHARFLFSLLENLSIDFPSHMIVSMIDIYWDTTTHDQVIFPSAITRIPTHLHISIPSSPLFYSISAISKESTWRSDAQLVTKWPRVEPTPTQ